MEAHRKVELEKNGKQYETIKEAFKNQKSAVVGLFFFVAMLFAGEQTLRNRVSGFDPSQPYVVCVSVFCLTNKQISSS
jgi:hypothetical protein